MRLGIRRHTRLLIVETLSTSRKPTAAAEHRLNSLPENGGTPSVLAAESPAFLWAEGDDLIFAHYADRLMRVPFAGGTQTLLQDGGFCTAHPTAN